MPAKTVKSSLSGRLGEKGRKAFLEHKNDETVYDTGGGLPDGIENGIAQLSECKFGIYEKGDNAGKDYFYAAGVVVEPKQVNGIPIEGLRTQFGPEALCDTPKSKSYPTLSAHLARVLNELRMLGVSTAELEDLDNLESVCAALKEQKPYFRFRTWKGKPTKEYPNPRVNHVWGGICEYEGNGAIDAVEDATGDAEPEAEAEEEAPTSDTDLSEATLESLVEAAEGGDTDAQAELTKRAKEVGVDAADPAYESWAKVGEMIEQSSPEEAEEEAEEEPEEEVPADPQKDETYKYRPIDPKTKKQVKKAIDCEVIAVFPKNRTVNLKSLDDGKTIYKAVSWDKLEPYE